MPTLSVNTHFPGYEIISELGRSNARVLKARHVASGDLVAIKHFTVDTSPETLRRFRVEADIMTSIAHPNVVRVREVQLDRAMPFIVMDWIEGGSLRTLLQQQGHLSVPATIRLGLQLAEAFGAIHPQGIIHRDIKPENILYRTLASGELHFLLTDFGVARLHEQTQTMTGQSLMTYEYASPEQFDNPRGVTVATDYYSLGVVLYECLAGRVPFAMTDHAGIAAFMDQVLRAEPPALTPTPGQALPPSLQTLLTWSLTKDPASRLSDTADLALLLGQANVEELQANRGAGRPAPPAPRPVQQTMVAPAAYQAPTAPEPVYGASYDEPTPAGGMPAWLGLVVGLIVVALIAGGVFYVKTRRDTPPVVQPDSTATPIDSTQFFQPSAQASDTVDTEPAEPADVTADTVAVPPTTQPEPQPTPAQTAPPDSSASTDTTGLLH
ncbi:hypothetical protein GCM10027578_09870 [Spirosoma luteolum]